MVLRKQELSGTVRILLSHQSMSSLVVILSYFALMAATAGVCESVLDGMNIDASMSLWIGSRSDFHGE